VARPLGDFLAPELALFLQLGQRLVDHRQQLQNDGRGNVGHDAQGENRETAQLPAGKQVHKPEEAAAVLLEKLRQLVGIHAGRGNVPTNAVNKQQSQGEQDAPAQVRNAENVRQFFKHYCKTSTLPPALVIFSCADLENLCALTVSATVSWPSPRILTGSLALITPALRSTSGVMVVSPKAARRSRLTMLYSLRKMLVKPRLGMRRCSGIWPPSKPRIMREPVRERCPLCPRVEVLPMPDPMPRPTRLRFVVAFFGARMFDKFISKLSAFSSQPSAFSPKRFTPRADSRKLMALFHHFDHMRHLGHHAADSLVVRTLDDLIQPGESQPLDHQLLFHRGTNGGTHPLQVNLPAARI